MSIDRILYRPPAGNADAPEPTHGSSTPTSCWRQERLTEARGVLADIGHHPDTLVLLACHVICAHGPDPDERTDALGIIRLLSARPPETPNIALNGGVA